MHHALRCCFLKQMTPWCHGLPTQWHHQPGPYAPYSHFYTLQHRCAYAQSTVLTMQTQTHMQRLLKAAYLHYHPAIQGTSMTAFSASSIRFPADTINIDKSPYGASLPGARNYGPTLVVNASPGMEWHQNNQSLGL